MDGTEMEGTTRSRESCVIVGVGASAGGLEAFQDLFSRLTVQHRIAMVLVQHLDPDHESLLQELLGKRTQTPVHTIQDGMAVEPGNIYLIPPGRSLVLSDGILRLSDFKSPRGQRRPIDGFFHSLAEDAGENGVGIILSGTGSDGAEGIKAIKATGGLVFAQDPGQARYDGMPKAAVETGAVDLILRTDEMVDALADYFDRRSGLEPAIESDREFLDTVFKHVRYHTGHDFSHYKQSTLLRRLSLRMSVLGIPSPADYVKRLIQDRDEARKLIHDVLINVTAFFRDTEVWDKLKSDILPELLADRGLDEEVRIWVPACSSGQEAYSLAMLVQEELARTRSQAQVVIFGTDIDEDALAQARRGLYPQSVVDEIPAEYLQTYFLSTTEGFEVGKALRAMVRFSHQSLVKDPPFGKLDMISCRNLTIYFEPKLQKVACSVFHYALNPGGLLLLGTSENPTGLAERFDDVDASMRLFRRNSEAARPLDLPLGRLTQTLPRIGGDLGATGLGYSATAFVERAILERHLPPYAVLNATGAVIYTSPGAEHYLRLRSGEQRFDLVSLVIPALQSGVRRLLNHGPDKASGPITCELTAELGGEARAMRLSYERLPHGERYILFEDLGRARVEPRAVLAADAGADSDYVRELEKELDDARQTIRTTVEELETSNEELKSSNEEMMSMNEELQSSNEELSTINDELLHNITELNMVNSDLSGFIESTGLATVFLDRKLGLRRFTPRAREFFRFVETDIGRSIEDIAAQVPMEPLAEACRLCLTTGHVQELELTTMDGAHDLIARIAPNIGEDDTIVGLVFTLVEVTDLRRYAQEIDEARAEAQRRLNEVEELYRVSPIGMALFDLDRRFTRINSRLIAYSGRPAEEHLGRRPEDIVPGLDPRMAEAMEHVIATGETVTGLDLVTRREDPEEETRHWILDFYPLKIDGRIVSIGCNVRDVTGQRNTEDELRRIMLELQHRVKNMLASVKALINRARRDTRDPKEVLTTLSERIDSMARTHALLTAENWQSTRIRDLIRPELHDVYGEDMVKIAGPDLKLNARASLAIGLTIHELATNAAKYGALSERGLGLGLRWMRVDEGEGELLRLIWTERCADPVTPSVNQGFGTTLIKAMIEGTLEGRLSFDWQTHGLSCTIEIPYENATRIVPVL